LETVRVKVRYFSFFQNITNKAEEYIYLKKPNVGGLIELLEKRYGSKAGKAVFEMRSTKNRVEFVVSVNGKLCDLECSLNDNDEVAFLPPMGGG
jgi:MoaD family protein